MWKRKRLWKKRTYDYFNHCEYLILQAVTQDFGRTIARELDYAIMDGIFGVATGIDRTRSFLELTVPETIKKMVAIRTDAFSVLKG